MKMPAEVETCDNLTDAYPSVQDFNAALGGGAIALYVISAVVIVALAVQFGFLTGHFLRHVPDERKARRVKNYSCRVFHHLGHGMAALVDKYFLCLKKPPAPNRSRR